MGVSRQSERIKRLYYAANHVWRHQPQNPGRVKKTFMQNIYQSVLSPFSFVPLSYNVDNIETKMLEKDFDCFLDCR